jgi:predicted NUDIX family phosphoesterase
MSIAQIEQILVVPTEVFHSLGYFQGFSRDVEQYLDTLLDPGHVRFLPRPDMETDPSFKQLIPYCILQHRDEAGVLWLYQYRRGSGQGEARLHALRSIGIGGHISSVDAADGTGSPYLEGLKRELEEELAIDCSFEERCVGLLNDDGNDVGRVHLGVVHLLELDSREVRPREVDLANAGFERLENILTEIDQFETWSQICLRALF